MKVAQEGTFITRIFILAVAACALYSCGGNDDKTSTEFSCDSYWSRVDLNSVCNIGFPDSFNFDSPPQAGATTICQANVLANSSIGYDGIILVIKTPSPENAIASFEAEKSAVHPDNNILDFNAGGDESYAVEITGTDDYIYRAVKDEYIVKYSCTIAPDLHTCLTKANHEAYVRELVSKL